MILAVVAKYVSEFSPYQQLVQEFFSAFGFFGGELLASVSNESGDDANNGDEEPNGSHGSNLNTGPSKIITSE